MILLLAGTSDARELALFLRSNGLTPLVSVVTPHAAEQLAKLGFPVAEGRRNGEQLARLIQERSIDWLVDATHPFAVEASRQAMQAAQASACPYVRYERPPARLPRWWQHHPRLHRVGDREQAARLLAGLPGTPFFTTGLKDLRYYRGMLPGRRLVCRILPTPEALATCRQLGFDQKDIIALQGPFSDELNRTLLRHFDAAILVSKDSGSPGSLAEKVIPALELGLQVVLIERPRLDYPKVCRTPAQVLSALGFKEE